MMGSLDINGLRNPYSLLHFVLLVRPYGSVVLNKSAYLIRKCFVGKNNGLGYSPVSNQDYLPRCRRWTHYGEQHGLRSSYRSTP